MSEEAKEVDEIAVTARELRAIRCVHCDRQRPAGREPCPYCGGKPLAHKQTPEEFQKRLKEASR